MRGDLVKRAMHWENYPETIGRLSASEKTGNRQALFVGNPRMGECQPPAHRNRKNKTSRPTIMIKKPLSALPLALLLLGNQPVEGQWTVTRLHPAGATFSAAQSTFDAQQAGVSTIGGKPVAGLWNGTAASWVNLKPAGSTESAAYTTNGTLQGGYARINNVNRACLWSGTAASWVDLQPASATESRVWGASGTRQVGFARISGAQRASLWSGTAASWTNLNPAGSTESQAFAASATQQVGYAIIGGVYGACRWSGSAGSWVGLNPVGSSLSTAYGTTGTQQAGFAIINDFAVASLWKGTAASWVNLNPAGANESYATANFGNLQAGFAIIADVQHASIWSGTAASWEDLSLVLAADTWADTAARGIWSDGSYIYVSGEGVVKSTGQYEALLWSRPIPAPTLTIIPAASGTVTLSWQPPMPGYVLQENPTLEPSTWEDSASGAENPVTVSTSPGRRFFRLRHP